MTKLPDSRLKLFDEGFIIRDPDGQPVPGVRYRIVLPDGSFEDGKTNDNGETHVIKGPDRDELQLYILRDDA